MATRTQTRRPEPTTAETDALKVELRIAPTEPPPVIRVTWSIGRPG